MTWLLAGGAVVVFLAFLLHGFVHSSVATVKRGALWLAAALVLVVAGAMVLGGRGAALLGLLLPALPWLVPALRRRWARRRFGAASPDQAATVQTATLAMRLDPASGTLSGRVLPTPWASGWAGRELAELSLEELRALLATLHGADAESVPLLESWLDRVAPAWRVAAEPAAGLDRAAALAMLGLAEGASPGEIRAAHRRLMRAAHPDRGGDAGRAALLNQARDLLLKM